MSLDATKAAKRDQAASPTDVGKSLNVNMVLARHRAARQESSAGHGAAREHGRRIHRLVRHVRARLEGRVQGAGRDLERDRRRDLARTDVGRRCNDRCRAHDERRAGGRVAANNHGTTDLEAYDLYLRGRFFFEKRGEAGLRRALDYFQQAAKKDTKFARAYAGIANVYALLPLYANVRVDSLMPLAMRRSTRGRARQHAAPKRSRRARHCCRRAGAGRCRARLSARAQARSQLRRRASMVRRAAAAQRPRRRGAHATQSAPPSSIRCRRSRFGSYALALAVEPHAGQRRHRRPPRRGARLHAARHAVHARDACISRRTGCPKRRTSWRRRATRLDVAATIGLLGYAYAKSGNTKRAARARKVARGEVGKISGAAGRGGRACTSRSATTRAR